MNAGDAVETPPAAHETAAVLRMHRAGMGSGKICSLLGISKTQLIHEMNSAIDDEQDAHSKGMKIQDSGIATKVNVTEKYAKDVQPGDYLMGSTFVERVKHEPGKGNEAGHVYIWLITGEPVITTSYVKMPTYTEPKV